MNQRLFQFLSFFNYWLDAVGAHSLHSPFFFHLYNRHIKPSKHSDGIEFIESLRADLLDSESEITVEDLGAGSSHFMSSTRSVNDIARVSLSPVKYSMLYRSLILYNKSQHILELGTSLGINTLYLSYENNGRTYTFEGSSQIADVAQKQFEKAGANNISVIPGNIDHTLPRFLDSIENVDFVLMDANHRYQPTMTYFDLLMAKAHSRTIIVVDDIHYSAEMERAWRELIQREGVYGSVDLFRCGLVFFDPSLNRQHFVLQF
ncbi:MAG: class I SAM-dependent methyltransferase [Chryseolinea sp.]